MSEEAERKYLTSRFMQIDFADLPIGMPNQTFNKAENEPYGEFWIIGGGEPFPMGGQGEGKLREATVGMIQLNIFVPEGKGTKAAALAADKFAKLFRWKQGRDEEGAVYRFRGMQKFTPQTRVGWTVAVYRIPYRREQVVEVDVGMSL